MNKQIRLRGHHGLCLHFYQGKGYSNEFVEHMTEVQRLLREDKDTMIQLTDCADTLCTFCPYRIGNACKSGQKVENYDRAVMELCGLRPGMQITWNDFSKIVKKNILEADRLKDICEDCQWYSICRKTDCVLY